MYPNFSAIWSCYILYLVLQTFIQECFKKNNDLGFTTECGITKNNNFSVQRSVKMNGPIDTLEY